MSAQQVELVLARLYVDEAARAQFLVDPLAYAREAGLDEDEVRQLADIDRIGLLMASNSFAVKRLGYGGDRPDRLGIGGWRARWVRFCSAWRVCLRRAGPR